MNEVYMHSKENLRQIVIKYCLSLLPLIIYGIYKNGLLLYQKEIITFFAIFKVVYLIALSMFSYILNAIIFKKKICFDLDLFCAMVIPLFMPVNINLFLYFLGNFLSLFICNILNKWLKINKIAFVKLGIIVIIYLLGKYSYLNALESQGIYSFNILDLLWGRNVGGIASTSIIYGFIFLMYNSLCNNYKWNIAFSSIISFLIVFCLLDGISQNAFTCSSAILALILAAPDSRYSPPDTKGMLIYGIILGIISGILTKYLNFYEGAFISIVLVSTIYGIFAKINKKCYNMNDFLKTTKKLLKKEGNQKRQRNN